MIGKVKLELIDNSTNESKIIEGKNILTNYIPDLIKRHYGFSITDFPNMTPKVLYGGIGLFDDKIPQNPNNYLYTDSNMVGHAATGLINANKIDMSLGDDEGAILEDENTKIFKYTFGPEIANGTINSICLMTNHGGKVGTGVLNIDVDYRANIGLGSSDTSSEILKRYPYDTDNKYSDSAFRINSSNSNIQPLYASFYNGYVAYLETLNNPTITKLQLTKSSNINIFENHTSPINLDDGQSYRKVTKTFENITINSIIGIDKNKMYVLPYFPNSGETANGFIIDFNDLSITPWNFTNKTAVNMYPLSPYSLTTNVPAVWRKIGISRNHLIFVGSNQYVYSVALDSSDPQSNNELDYIIKYPDNTIYKQNIYSYKYNSKTYYVSPFLSNINDNIVLALNGAGDSNRISGQYYTNSILVSINPVTRYCGQLDTYQMHGYSNYAFNSFDTDIPIIKGYRNDISSNNNFNINSTSLMFSYVSNNLVSIYNLDEPIIKDSNHTLKIEYTISIEEE